MERLLDVTTLLSIALALLVLFSVRRAHIRVEYSVSWLAAAVLLGAVSRWKGLVEKLAEWLGVTQAPVALLFVVLTVFLLVLFRMSILISELRDNNIALAQRVAILEFHIRSLHEKSNQDKKH